VSDSSIDSALAASGVVRQRRRLPTGVYLVLALIVTGVAWALFAPASHAAGGNDQAIAQGKELFAQGCSSKGMRPEEPWANSSLPCAMACPDRASRGVRRR
jgi:hypothetical protein